ncbi:MAG: methyltransferase domain-containing protein [Pyrinomonadaceae bacterium]|nr:methyltransferase domain-containing protein [Phycisphaerales bacterium]
MDPSVKPINQPSSQHDDQRLSEMRPARESSAHGQLERDAQSGSISPQIHTRAHSFGVSHATAPLISQAPCWHDAVYQQAQGDMSKVRWADGRPNPMMVSWLNAEAPGLVRPGSRVVVVGCGLGDDVAELVCRGYDAVGFDVSPTAVSWARKRFPDHASLFNVADVMAIPARFRHRFDLVIEIYTLQSLDPARRERAAAGVASLAGPQGHVLAICRGRDEAQLLEHLQGPPWPLCPSELLGLMEANGLRPLHGLDDFFDDESKPVRRLRGVFVRA